MRPAVPPWKVAERGAAIALPRESAESSESDRASVRAMDAGPFPDAAAHLGAHLERVRLCWRRLRLVRELDGAAPDPAKAERVDAELALLDAEIATRIDASDASGLPIERLRERFDLGEPAIRLLVTAASPGLDLDLGRLFSSFGGEGGQPDVALLVDLLGRDPGERDALLDQLSPTGPLVRWRLLRLGMARGWQPEGPLLRRGVTVSERVGAYLRGRTAFESERFERVATLRANAPSERVPETLRQTLVRALFRDRDGRRLPLVVIGPALAGKATAVTVAARERGHAVLEVDLEALVLAREPHELLLDLMREARLADAVLLLRRADTLTEARPELKRAVLHALTDGNLWVAVTSRQDLEEPLQRLAGAQRVRIELPGEEEQRRLWARALPAETLADEVRVEDLLLRYRLTPGDILEAGAQASASAQLRGPDEKISLDDVVASIRGRLRHRLGDVADLVTNEMRWDDLVLREDTHGRVRELLASVKFRSTVMDEWGFAGKVAYGRALSALFSGPPGTGKTMVATLIARELGLELFRVDLSRVVSKWVGETEKNLGRAFDEAQNSQAVLLFDEADSLFAKRTDVKSSNDRYANLEVNYLLQRLESFEGIVLLTTNNQSAIDDAFRRRLRFRIDFPAPDEEERERLWRAMVPASAPISDDVDFDLLARKFAMSGGYIKNAVVRAAYLAAADPERIINQEVLLRAASREWEDMGNLSIG